MPPEEVAASGSRELPSAYLCPAGWALLNLHPEAADITAERWAVPGSRLFNAFFGLRHAARNFACFRPCGQKRLPSKLCFLLLFRKLNLCFHTIRRHMEREVKRVDALTEFKRPADQGFHIDLTGAHQG